MQVRHELIKGILMATLLILGLAGLARADVTSVDSSAIGHAADIGALASMAAREARFSPAIQRLSGGHGINLSGHLPGLSASTADSHGPFHMTGQGQEGDDEDNNGDNDNGGNGNNGDNDNGDQGNGDDDEGTPSATPEPATMLLLGTGMLLVGVLRRRRATT